MLSRTLRAELTRLLPDRNTPYAIAYSGGGDSLSVLQALARDRALKGVLHIDHGLREGSARDAVLATLQAEQLGRKVEVLRWEPGDITTGMQEKARRARYRLMGSWCRARGIDHLVVAHHADDQAETVLMRVERGSGWRGAAGMSALSYGPVWPELAGITLVRPALELSREALRAELGALRAVQDPSNADPSFARVRARGRLGKQPELRDEMLALAGAMARGRGEDRKALRDIVDACRVSHEGEVSVPDGLSPAHLAALLPAVGGHAGPAEPARAAAALPALDDGPVALGCGVLAERRADRIQLMRDPVAMTGRRDGTLEPTAVPLDITADPQLWDGRFMFSGRGGTVNPEGRGRHVGFRVLYGRDVVVRNLVAERLRALVRPQP